MSELVIRGRHNDHRVLQELLGAGGVTLEQSQRLRRVVVDATAVASQPLFATAAADSGKQLLVDPQTPFLEAAQHPQDTWARLPFASAARLTMADFQSPAQRDALIDGVVTFQIDHGATAIIPPYIYVTDLDGPHAQVQRDLWTRTADYLDGAGVRYPLLPVLAVSRQKVPIAAAAWRASLGNLVLSASGLTDGPIGLALSSSSAHHSADGLHRSMTIWRHTASIARFLAWNCGDLGPLAVAIGAAGYESGLCGAERCNMPEKIQSRSGLPEPGPRWYGAYVHTLNRSLTRSAVEDMLTVSQLHGALACPDPDCCSSGSGIVGRARRQHAARSRLEELCRLDRIGAVHWKLHRLEQQAADAAAIAGRMAKLAKKRGYRIGVSAAPYEAMALQLRAVQETNRRAVS